MSGGFALYAEAGFVNAVIPILPRDCRLTPNSTLDPSQLGKIPGEYSVAHGAWYGMKDWTTREFTIDDCRRWDRWPACNVGLRTADYWAMDLDGYYEPFNQWIEDQAREWFGDFPVRTRGTGSRRLLLFRRSANSELVGKMRFVAQFPDEARPHPIEFLAAGQQCVIAGIHPSGEAYGWRYDLGPLTLGAANLPAVESIRWREFIGHVQTVGVPLFNGVLVKAAGGRPKWGQDGAISIGDASLMAPDHSTACAALYSLTDIRKIDYDEWIMLMHAFKGATGGDGFRDFFDWCRDYPNEEEMVRDKWDSIDSSSIGWVALLNYAQGHGKFKYVEEFTELAALVEAEETRHSAAPMLDRWIVTYLSGDDE